MSETGFKSKKKVNPEDIIIGYLMEVAELCAQKIREPEPKTV